MKRTKHAPVLWRNDDVCIDIQVRGSIEEAEELQDDNERKDEDGEQTVKPASRERQKELLGRLPPTDKQRGRQMDYSPYCLLYTSDAADE